jgi:hypothetical protein
MTKPLRLEFPNALYHVTSRGDRRENIYEDDDDDRIRFLEILEGDGKKVRLRDGNLVYLKE